MHRWRLYSSFGVSSSFSLHNMFCCYLYPSITCLPLFATLMMVLSNVIVHPFPARTGNVKDFWLGWETYIFHVSPCLRWILSYRPARWAKFGIRLVAQHVYESTVNWFWIESYRREHKYFLAKNQSGDIKPNSKYSLKKYFQIVNSNALNLFRFLDCNCILSL